MSPFLSVAIHQNFRYDSNNTTSLTFHFTCSFDFSKHICIFTFIKLKTKSNLTAMAKILNYFHLCPINDEEEFLGLSQDETKGNVINTLGKNIIITIKVSINFFSNMIAYNEELTYNPIENTTA